MLRDDHGDVALVVAQKHCPQCGTRAVQLNEPKSSLPVEIVTAVRDAGLTADQLEGLARAIRESDASTTPRELADRAQIPAAGRVIAIASKAGKNWLVLLGVVIALVAAYVAHSDAEQARRDAQQAIEQSHEDVEAELRASREPSRSTKELSQDQVDRLVSEIEKALERDRAH
jgi:hypothetical protein